MMRNRYILISRKYGSIDFDKDELISQIENFDEFDREGLTLKHVCEDVIAQMVGVPKSSVYVSKLSWNDSNVYRANYCINNYINATEVKRKIRDYVHENGAGLMSCDISVSEDKVVFVKITVVYGRSLSKEMFDITSAEGIKAMLTEKYPNIEFSVDEKVNVHFY